MVMTPLNHNQPPGLPAKSAEPPAPDPALVTLAGFALAGLLAFPGTKNADQGQLAADAVELARLTLGELRKP
ncbi:MAG: hypothetical protein NUV34_05885 [Sulfuricaulis sp.]|nr:hypothetical protein [Sulfuricaulis sp.]